MIWTQMALATVQCCLETDDSELDPAEMVQNKLESPGTDNIWPTTGYYMYLLAYSCPLSRTQRSRSGRWTQKNWWLPPGPTKTLSSVYWTMSLLTVWALDIAIEILDILVWKQVESPQPDPTPHWFHPGISSRDSAVMEAAWEWAAPPHSGCNTTGCSHQQSEHVILNYGVKLS
jgi:hypothetical protein